MITFSLETSHHIYTQRLLISLNIGTGEVSVNKWVLYELVIQIFCCKFKSNVF